MTQVSEPFPLFYDTDGKPLEGGMIYVGEANLDPRTNQIELFSDEARTVPLAQPVRTLNGRPSVQGTPVNIYTAEVSFSIDVLDRKGVPVVSLPEQVGLSADDISFLQSGTGAVARTVQAKLRETVSVKDFGAVGDGVANDTVAIQAAIDAVGVAGGGTVYLPAGAYRITAVLNINAVRVRILGAGRRATRIMQATASAGVFSVGFEYFAAENFSIEYAAQGTAGGTAFSTNAFYGLWNNIYIRNAHIGWHFQPGSNSQFLTNVVAEDCTQNGFLVRGDNVKVTDFFVLNQISASFCTLGCVRFVDRAEGCIFSSGQFFGGAFPMTTAATVFGVGTRPAYNKFTGVYFDSGQNSAILDQCVEFDFANCWFSNRPGGGVNISNSDGIRFVGGGAVNNATHGALVEATAKNVLFNGFSVRGNGTAAANTHDGLIFAGGTTDFAVIGCTIGGDAALGFGTQRNGISIGLSCDQFSIIGNDLRGNGTGALNDLGAGTNSAIYGNIGYRTNSRGQATVASSTTSIVVNHGLNVTPEAGDIQLTLGGTAAGSVDLYADTITATQFTIRVAPAPSVDLPVNWQVRSKGA